MPGRGRGGAGCGGRGGLGRGSAIRGFGCRRIDIRGGGEVCSRRGKRPDRIGFRVLGLARLWAYGARLRASNQACWGRETGCGCLIDDRGVGQIAAGRGAVDIRRAGRGRGSGTRSGGG